MTTNPNPPLAPDPVDQILPLRNLILYGFQHVLVMAASPITAVFLVAQTLGFDPAMTVSIISATFLVCGIGSILQSHGPDGRGARLSFIMVPGGAPIAIFWPSPPRPTCRRRSARR